MYRLLAILGLAIMLIAAGCSATGRQEANPPDQQGVTKKDGQRDAFRSGVLGAAAPPAREAKRMTPDTGAGLVAVPWPTHDRDLGPGSDKEVLPPKLKRRYHTDQWRNEPNPWPFLRTINGQHTSTFAIDVDTASYGIMRQALTAGRLPDRNQIRVEELINAFDYNYPAPEWGDDQPLTAGFDSCVCPWNANHRLVRINLQGQRLEQAERPASNLVFLIDTSGSMRGDDKLPLLKKSLRLLVANLDERDSISLVTYASRAEVLLRATRGSERRRIINAIDRLGAGGGTNGAGGLQLAYAEARRHFVEGGTNRVILATDGDFNVGISDPNRLAHEIQQRANEGIYLNALRFGQGRSGDRRMEELSNKGNGFYAYVDSYTAAREIFGSRLTAQLITIAKDAKVQVFFNPATIGGFRLIGYENRRLAHHQFDNDAVDGGDIGAGHSVTAIYEIVPAGLKVPQIDPRNPFVDPGIEPVHNEHEHDLMVRLRYQPPGGGASTETAFRAAISDKPFTATDADFRWATAVAAAGMHLCHHRYRGTMNWDTILDWARSARGSDHTGRRSEFIGLLQNASGLAGY